MASTSKSEAKVATGGGGGGSGGGRKLLREYPVYVTKQLAGQVYLVQYPLRSRNNPVDKEAVDKVDFKPKQRQLEIRVPLDVGNQSYLVDHDDPNSLELTETTYVSSLVVPRTNHFLSFFDDGAFYLAPLSGALQMRPAFRAFEVNQRQAAPPEREAPPEELDDGYKQVQVQVKKKESTKAVDAKRRSYAYYKALADKEESIEFQRHSRTARNSVDKRQWLKYNMDDEVYLKQDPDVYINNLFAPVSRNSYQPEAKNTALMSLQTTREMGLDRHVESTLRKALIIGYLTVSHLTRCKDHDLLIRTLSKYGILVRGRWVCRSELIHTDYIRQRQRDTLLSLFHKKETVQRRELTDMISAQPEDSKQLFAEVAVYYPKASQPGWKLKGVDPIDEVDEDVYAKLEKLESEFWDKRIAELTPFIDGCREARKRARRGVDTDVAMVAFTQEPRDFPLIGKDKKEQLQDFLNKLFHKYAVLKAGPIRRHLEERRQVPEQHNYLAGDVTDDEILRFLKTHCVKLHGDRWALQTKYTNQKGEARNKYRRIALDLFKINDSIQRKDFMDKANEEEDSVPIGSYHQVMRELAYNKGPRWHLLSGNGTGEPEGVDDNHDNHDDADDADDKGADDGADGHDEGKGKAARKRKGKKAADKGKKADKRGGGGASSSKRKTDAGDEQQPQKVQIA